MWKKSVILVLVISAISCSPLDQLRNDLTEAKFLDSEVNAPTAFLNPDHRLPNDTKPIKYELRLETDIDQGIFNFTGFVRIHLRVVERTQRIVLNYKQTTNHTFRLYDENFNSVPLQSTSVANLEELIIVEPRDIQEAGTVLILDISYIGTIRNDGGGFYRAYYDEEDGTRVWFATTQFEVTDARHAMPCYDEPGIRAPIQLEITHGSDYEAVSNMPVESTNTVAIPGKTITKFMETPSIQTYLLAFLISPYKSISNNDTRVEQRIYAKPSSIDNGEADFAIGVVRAVLEKCEEHFGVEYPLSKMDHAAITQFNFGAMENIGLITYIENGLLYDPNTPPLLQKSRQMSIIRLIAHEYVHQWFGNIVSPQWWSYTWLNEGFATLYASYIPHLLFPNMNFMNIYVTSVLPRAFANDVGSSWSMNHYTEVNAELWNKFGAIGYQKSGSVLRMFQETLTIPTFTKGLKYYLDANHMTAVTPQHLHAGLQKAYNEDFLGNTLDIDELMGMWENNAGYPIVTISMSGNSMIISQRRYPTGNGEIYAIPLTFTTKSNKNFDQKTPKKWLNQREMTLTFEEANLAAIGDWIIFNIEQVGYYRVDYSRELWYLLIHQLRDDHEEIPPINRAVLFDEILIGWNELNRIDARDVLKLLEYLIDEKNPIVWSKVAPTLTLLHNRLMGTAYFEHFLEFVKDITKPHIDNHGYEAIDFEDSDTTDLRSTVRTWNCQGLNENCLQHEHAKFLQYYNSGDMTATFNFCDALRNVNAEIHSSIVAAVASNRQYGNRNNYLQTLGCALDRDLITSYLATSTDASNNYTTVERRNVIVNTLSRSPLAFDTTLDFLEDSYQLLGQRFDPNDLTYYHSITTALGNYANTEAQITRVSALLQNLQINLITNENAVDVNNRLTANKNWYERNEEAIKSFFENEIESTTDGTETTTQAANSAFLSFYAIVLSFFISFFVKINN